MTKVFSRKYTNLCSLILGILLMLSCEGNKTEAYYLISGNAIDKVELNTIIDLKNDLSKVVDAEVYIISESEEIPKNGICFIFNMEFFTVFESQIYSYKYGIHLHKKYSYKISDIIKNIHKHYIEHKTQKSWDNNFSHSVRAMSSP